MIQNVASLSELVTNVTQTQALNIKQDIGLADNGNLAKKVEAELESNASLLDIDPDLANVEIVEDMD